MVKNKGYTLIEVLVALFIMSIGFLALSQMQYLSFRKIQLAHSATTATNLIQSFSDIDLSRIKMIHSHNQNLVKHLQTTEDIESTDPIFTYCNAEPCGGACPCDPFKTINSNTDVNNSYVTCSGIDMSKINIKKPYYSTNKDTCKESRADFYITRRVDLKVDNNLSPQQRVFNIEYSVKTPRQFNSQGLDTGSALATNTIEITAHVDITTLASAPENIEKLLVIPNIP